MLETRFESNRDNQRSCITSLQSGTLYESQSKWEQVWEVANPELAGEIYCELCRLK
jgi:hypothetical protein